MYNVINKPKIFSVLIIFLLVFSLFSGLVNGLEIEVQNIDIGNSGEYIIELKDKPLFQYINSIKDRFVNNIIKKLEINKYKKTLLSSQES